jgi:hypothetical protein
LEENKYCAKDENEEQDKWKLGKRFFLLNTIFLGEFYFKKKLLIRVGSIFNGFLSREKSTYPYLFSV